MQVITGIDRPQVLLAYPGTGMSNKKFKLAVSDIVGAVSLPNGLPKAD